MNLIDPTSVGPAHVYDEVAEPASRWPAPNSSGWCPAPVLLTVDQNRWGLLDLSAERTIEARLEARGVPLS